MAGADGNQMVDPAGRLMDEFAVATGLRGDGPAPVRYLWTDAFAVCNFLGLYGATRHARYRDMALRLVDQVHQVLGRHRQDDPRSGWISGLAEEEGAARPTAGGLRIGKKINERRLHEPLDQLLEWDRDGQYYHYLTKWMHALDQTARCLGESRYHRWAVELACTAHRAFAYRVDDRGTKRLHWKMSIDLTRSLVPSMGHHDPLDGLITFCRLRSSPPAAHHDVPQELQAAIDELAAMCRGQDWTTDDPLGVGGLLTAAYLLAQMLADRDTGAAGDTAPPASLLDELLAAALAGLIDFQHQYRLEVPAPYRLAFRELGLAIGLRAVRRLEELAGRHRELFADVSSVPAHLNALAPFLALGEEIERFWLQPENQDHSAWTDHEEINRVMLATALFPDGYLGA